MTDKQSKSMKEDAAVNQRVHKLIEKIDQYPQKTENYLKLATELIEQGSFAQATQLLEEAKHLVKHPQDLDYNLAVCYYMQGDFDKSLTLLNQIPNDDLVLYQKALVFLKLGQGQKALAHALTIKQVDDKVLELLGDIWLSLGELSEARTCYEKISPNKRTAKVYFMLGISILDSDRKKATSYLKNAKEKDPKYFKQAQEQYGAILKMVNEAEKKND